MRFILGFLGVIAALAAIWFIGRDLIPPKHMTLAAGGRGSGYWQIAEEYRTILARDGIALTVLETAGSGENAQLLESGAADAAIVQGGVPVGGKTEALAALFHEPVFFFVRNDAEVPGNPGRWAGLRIAAGGEGSGTRLGFQQFLSAVGLTAKGNTLMPLGGAAAAQALLTDEVDMAVFVAPLGAPYLQPLFQASSVSILPLENVPAIVGHLDHSVDVTLPRGGIVIDPPVPSADIPMVALDARLVAQADLHPSLVDRLVEAARQIHRDRDPITAQNSFPSVDTLTMPVDVYAGDLLRNGTSSLQQYLPYWVVAQINRVAILLLPILFLLVPLLRALPGLYSWRMRYRVFRHYQTLREIDQQVREAPLSELRGLSDQLNSIDKDLANLRLPLPYREYAYTTRMHVELLKRRIVSRRKSALREMKQRRAQARALGFK